MPKVIFGATISIEVVPSSCVYPNVTGISQLAADTAVGLDGVVMSMI